MQQSVLYVALSSLPLPMPGSEQWPQCLRSSKLLCWHYERLGSAIAIFSTHDVGDCLV